MTTIAILFWTGVFLVFYTYLGYGILLWTLVKIREALRPERRFRRRAGNARPGGWSARPPQLWGPLSSWGGSGGGAARK